MKKEKAEKSDIVLITRHNVQDNYFELFKEDGWELVDNIATPWYIWRKSYEDERPNIYTDTKSLIERNNRLLKTIGLILPSQFFVIYLALENRSGKIELAFGLFGLIMIVFFGYIIIQLYRYNKNLKEETTYI